MSSALEEKINDFLKSYLRKYDLSFEREFPAGFGSRFDFYIHTKTPIALEIQGTQHYKPNEFFFKTVENYEHYKSNDNFKKILCYSGQIYLIEIEEDLTYSEFEEIMDEYDFMLTEGEHGGEEEEKKTYQNKAYQKGKEESDYVKAQKERARAYRKEQYNRFKETQRNNKKK